MSITEWVINTYNTEEYELEEAKNFVFIWSIFENQSRSRIFSTDQLKMREFKVWNNNLLLTSNITGLFIKDLKSGNEISGDLVNEINKSFNHFYQRYKKDDQVFLDTLFNQTDSYTLIAKKSFKNFAKSIKQNNIKDKILFLFLVAKRMRNKFFHGIKNINDIKTDQKEFGKINAYLISIISLIENYK